MRGVSNPDGRPAAPRRDTELAHLFLRVAQVRPVRRPTTRSLTRASPAEPPHAVHSQPGDKAPDTGAVLQYASSKRWGFLTLTIDHQTISGVGTEVDRDGNVQQGDKFNYSVKPIVLANPKSVPTL